MKRNVNLVELSRDHHHGLLLGWKVKQGLKNQTSLEEIQKYIVHFVEIALKPHFQEEETQLLVFLNPENDFRKRTEKEHEEILALAEQLTLSNLLTEDGILKFADFLEKHIRFEERELFPYMENNLSEKELEEIGTKIAAIHKPYVENYSNEFWINKDK